MGGIKSYIVQLSDLADLKRINEISDLQVKRDTLNYYEKKRAASAQTSLNQFKDDNDLSDDRLCIVNTTGLSLVILCDEQIAQRLSAELPEFSDISENRVGGTTYIAPQPKGP